MPFGQRLEGGKINLCGEYTALSICSFQLPVIFFQKMAFSLNYRKRKLDMKKFLMLTGIFTVLIYNTANAREYYKDDGYHYEEQPRYEQHQVRYRDDPKYTRQHSQYRRISKEEERNYNERRYIEDNPKTIRPYIGLDVATTSIKFEDEDYKDYLSDSLNAYSFNVGVKFNQNFGVEAFIQQSSEESKKDDWGDNTKLKYNAIGLDAIGYIPVSQDFELLASLGIAQYNFNCTEEYDYEEYTEWEKSTLNTIGYRAGIGAQFNINEHFALRAMARYIKFSDDDIIKNMTEFSLGLRYIF